MAQLRLDYSDFIKRNTQIVVVGPEGAGAFESYWLRHNLPFIGLPDPTSSVLKLYRQEINLFKLGRLPAQVIIDMNGLTRYVHYGNSMSDIPANADLLSIIDKITT